MSEKSYPSFYAVIPHYVRYCKELEFGARLLYGELTALASKEGYCWASNKYFEDIYDVDERTIRRWLESLKAQNFIEVEIIKNGFQTERKIWITSEIKEKFTTGRNRPSDRTESSDRPDKIVLHSITSSTTSKESSSFPPSSVQSDEEDLRKDFSCSDEIWEEALKRCREKEKQNPGHIGDLKKYITRVIDGLLQYKNVLENGILVTKEEEHKEQAVEKEIESDIKNDYNNRVIACKEYVEILKGSFSKIIRYDISDREWKLQTGW